MARPNAPVSLTVERLGDRDFKFDWPAVAGATSYGVVYLTGSQNPPFTKWVSGIKGTTFTGRRFSGEAAKTFAVYATNRDGNSLYSPSSGPWYLPVKAPVNVKAVGEPSVNRVTVSWATSAYYQSGVEVQRDAAGTVTSTVLGTGTSGNVGKSWVDTSPVPGVDAKYRVRHFAGAVGAQSRVFSEWSQWSNVVRGGYLPPKAPTVWIVEVTPMEVAPVIHIGYQSTDGTAQTGVELSYRLNQTGAWTTMVGPVGKTVLLPTTLAAGVYEIQARVKGAGAVWGPWSGSHLFRVTPRPTATVTNPPTPFSGGRATVTWTYSQGAGIGQDAWWVRLKQGSTILEDRQGVGAGLSCVLSTDLKNATAYTVEVWVYCKGVESVVASRSFTTAFTPPATPSITAVWVEEVGGHQVSVAPGSGGAATVKLVVYRNVGDLWERVGDYAAATSFFDYRGRSAGSTLYRVVAETALGALSTREVEVVADSPCVWLHNAAGIGVGLKYNLDWSLPEEVAHGETIFFDGDTTATWLEDTPKSYSRRLQVSATTLPDRVDDQARAEREALKALLRGSGRVTARLPDGDTITGGMTGISPSVGVSGVGKVSVTITEAR